LSLLLSLLLSLNMIAQNDLVVIKDKWLQYIAAFDDRIYATAPENYLTNYTRLLQTIGPQDAEQNLFNIISSGLDHPDFLIVRAPKPAMMITTTGDMFSIQGAMETESEVARIYKAYNSESNFSRVEDDAAHASTPKNRTDLNLAEWRNCFQS